MKNKFVLKWLNIGSKEMLAHSKQQTENCLVPPSPATLGNKTSSHIRTKGIERLETGRSVNYNRLNQIEEENHRLRSTWIFRAYTDKKYGKGLVVFDA